MSMSADERKLQPVFGTLQVYRERAQFSAVPGWSYDIHAQRFKLAESSITRHLKKAPKSQTALVARFVLQHEQRSPTTSVLQALAVVRRQGELSPTNLWRVERALKEMRRWDLVLAMNQEASDRYPESEQHTAQLHLSSVACWDTETMAKTSRKLFNSTKDVAWARRAAWAEWAKNAPQPTRTRPIPDAAPTGSLKVASLLLSTTSRSPQAAAPTSDVLWLHMQILLSAGENKKAHGFLVKHGREGGLARDWYRMQGVQEVGRREADAEWVWETELDGFLEYWKSDSMARRNYAYYRHTILAAMALLRAKPDLVQKARDAFIGLDNEIGEKERAPRLARLQLDVELIKQSSDLAMPIHEWEELVTSYWRRWGSKGSIVPELEGIAGDRWEWMRGVMEKRILEGHSDESTYRELINAHVYLLRGHEAGWQPTEDNIKSIWKLYIEGLAYGKIAGKNLSDKDIQPADQIGLAAVQLMLYTPGQEAVLKAITCLEYILEKSPACAHAKFLLIRLYRLIGAPLLALTRLESLGLSEIQLDTIMHIWHEGGSTDAFVLADQAGWSDRTKPVLKMYNASGVHLPENLRQAISQESYSKIHSIRELAKTQSNSLSRASLHLETGRLTSQVPESEAEWAAGLDPKEMVDTRNWELMPCIGGNRENIQDLRHLMLAEERPEGVVMKISAERAVRQFLNGEEVELPSTGLDQAGLNETDRAYYTALLTLLERALSKPTASLERLYDNGASIKLDGSRWSTYHHIVSVLQLFEKVSTISNKIRPGLSKKAKSPIMDELDTAHTSLVKALDDLLKKTRDLQREDSELDPKAIMNGLIEEDEFVQNRVELIKEHRISGLQRLESEIKRIIASVQKA